MSGARAARTIPGMHGAHPVRRLLAPACLALAACVASSPPPEGPPSALSEGTSELEIQALVMLMADDYSAALGETTYLVLREGDVDPTARWLALSFLRNGMGAAIDIASGPNPDVALLDLLVLGSLQTGAFESHWVPAGIDPELGAAAVARLRAAEDALWSEARSVISPDQEATLRKLLATWVAEHPDQTVVSFVRFEDFTKERELSTAAARGRASGLLAEVGEATRAVDEARLLGERALWFASRYPYVLGQQVELTTYRIADQPEVRTGLAAVAALAESSRVLAGQVEELDARVAAAFTQLAAERASAIQGLREALEATTTGALDGLALRIGQEREDAVEHLFTRARSELDALLDDVDARRQGLASSLEVARATAVAAAEAGAELTATAEAFDGLAARFDRLPGEDGRPPLRLEDLRAAATEAHGAARELNELFARAEEAGWDRGLESASARADDLVDALFLRAAALVVLLVLGLALVRRVPRPAARPLRDPGA